MKQNFSLFVIVTQDVIFKPFFIFLLINKLKEENLAINQIIEVKKSNSNSKKKKNSNTFVWGKIAFFQFSIIFLIKKFISTLPVPLILKWKSTIKLIAKKEKINYQFISDVNKYLLKKDLRKNDIVFSFQHQIIKDPEQHNCFLINCHPGDLSLYRGIKPIFWTMLDRKKYGIISIHHIDSGIDTGRLIIEKKFKLAKSLGNNYYEAYRQAPALVPKAIKKLLKNNNIEKFKYKKLGSNSYKTNPNNIHKKRFYNSGLVSRLSIINFFRLLKFF